MQEMKFDYEPENTSDIEYCGNVGCCANENGKCVMTGTGCFGYIDPDWESSDECYKGSNND